MTRYVIAAAFLLCIPVANWTIQHVGTVCVPAGPCLVPVAPWLMAPSGVLVIGVALVLRSLLQEAAGRAWVVACIGIGAVLSAAIAPPALVIASAVAFLGGELADWGVYSRLRANGMGIALLAAGLAGSIVDSALFLGLAFGSLEFMAGQVVGKLWATLAAVLVLRGLRRLTDIAAPL
jgi:uncharacterized PurR-regulated membrane protein YhhQ (DUF165 family)